MKGAATPAAQGKRQDKKPMTALPAQPVNTGVKAAAQAGAPPRLLAFYRAQVTPAMMKQFGYTNPF